MQTGLKREVYLGNVLLKSDKPEIKGQFTEIGGEKFYKISNINRMADFFMTIVSDSDHWMFISSNGSLSAGRKDRNNALFPYYTVDKIHDYKGITGSKTLLLVTRNKKTYLWEPFSDESDKIYSIQRNLYKSIYGNKIIFEELNTDLGVGFQYGWYNTERFGFVKKSEVVNLNSETVNVEILDGITNILPNGIDYDFQNAYSNLSDAYKKNELLEQTRLGLFMLSSIPVDRAEPSESLKATTVWLCGLKADAKILLSNRQLENFKKGQPLAEESDIRANRGAYYVNTGFELTKNDKQNWMIVAEINRDSVDVANLNQFIKNNQNPENEVNADIEQGTLNLKKIVSKADGLQMCNDELSTARHFSNTLFNLMRGGYFTSNYNIDSADFKFFARQINKNTAEKYEDWLNKLPAEISYPELTTLAEKTAEPDLIRICYEYLPLTFSRRHGDPSRPWNQFSIETKNEDGSPKLNYQGNWRDIFQNWEALGFSYPEYLKGMMSRFLNATTADGYNPYRITRDGIDWESPDPHDPWAYIGYWGDHQIIYLLKFLELSRDFHPGELESLLSKEIFVYANVPYRIKNYAEIVKNPKDTIAFDFELNHKISELTKVTGADGRLLRGSDSVIYRVNLTEKILVTMLAKLSNFIPEAGIWLNTQRPEWNDANNALVGNGVSMVTLYYLRRFMKFWLEQLNQVAIKGINVSEEVKTLFEQIFHVFTANTSLLGTGFSDENRRYITDNLGEAGSKYRNAIYENSFSGKKAQLSVQSLIEFMQLGLEYLDQSVRVNRREDGLYHAYNLVSFSEKGISIRYLYEMLEGQVAVLSSGYLTVHESLNVLNALKASKMFRTDQYSYLLYPDRQLPLFIQKNNIPAEKVKSSKLLGKLVEENDTTILKADDLGNFHFNGSFRNAMFLESALKRLDSKKYGVLLSEEKEKVIAIYESLFDHQSFTGRSGTFYGYEGLGSIYWHMVSKLLLAAQECYFKGVEENADPVTIGKIKDHYYEIKAGIGLNKSPELYGAFPTDAYSHTPGNAGAQQPGMTGQVKEDFLSRMRELGIQIENGKIKFRFSLINPEEFLKQKSVFQYFDLSGEKRQIILNEGQLAFTFCQVPVVYTLSKEAGISILKTDGSRVFVSGDILENEWCAALFERDGSIGQIDVLLKN